MWKTVITNDIILSNYVLTKVGYTKLRGIILNDKLKWTNQTSYIKN